MFDIPGFPGFFSRACGFGVVGGRGLASEGFYRVAYSQVDP